MHSRPQRSLLFAVFAALGAALVQGQQLGPSVTPVDGSTPPAVAAGQPTGSYSLSNFETVNLFNGNLEVKIPLLSLPGRGSTAIEMSLPIQRRWVMERISPEVAGNYTSFGALDLATLNGIYGATPSYGPGTLSVREIGTTAVACSNSSAMYKTTLTRLSFVDADGTEHEFVDALSGGAALITEPVTDNPPVNDHSQCVYTGPNRGRVWVTRDGTFSTIILDAELKDGTNDASGAPPFPIGTISGNMYLKDGTVYHIDGGGHVASVRDRNGNQVSYTYGTDTSNPSSFGRVTNITDSLGRQVAIAYAPPNVADQTDRYDSITYPGGNGASRIIKVHYCYLDPSAMGQTCPHYAGTASTTYQALFGYQSANSRYNPVSVSFVELPDSRRYEFSYNPYGELTKIKLPTGGSFQYVYGPGDPSSGASGVIGVTSEGAGLQIYRRVIQRNVYLDDSTIESATTYSTWYTPNCTTGVTWCTTVGAIHQDSSGRVLAAERHFFYGGANDPSTYFPEGTFYPKWTEGKEYQSEELTVDSGGAVNAQTATALRRDLQVWEQRSCDPGEACPSAVNAGATSPIDVRVKEKDAVLADSGQQSSQKYLFDRYNNVIQKDETDYGGGLARETKTTFVSSKTIGSRTWDYLKIPEVNGQYGTFSGDYSSIVHIRNLPHVMQIFGPSLQEVARTTYDYDNYSSNPPYTGPLADDPGLAHPLWDSSVPDARGNLTETSEWLFSNGSVTRSLNSYKQYDVAGNLLRIIDPKGNSTSLQYSSGYMYGFPTTWTNALSQSAARAYDLSTGKVTQFTGLNGETSNYQYADTLDRLTEIDSPDGGVTMFSYCDAGSSSSCLASVPSNSITKSVRQNSCQQTNSLVSDVIYDGLGRAADTHVYEGSGAIEVRTAFDGLGRTASVSNPARTQPTDFTVTSYDSLGRVKRVTTPDGSMTSTQWTGNTAKISDAKGFTISQAYDALRRLVQVTEDPDGPLATVTNYRYDPIDDLIGVCQNGSFNTNGNCQAGLGRSFVYDSLKRLKTATNPESGTATYTYDDNGNLLTRQDARGRITCYGLLSGGTCSSGYDALNRLTAKTYGATGTAEGVSSPEVSYVWDTIWKGRLTSAASDVSTTQFGAYDPMGRPTQSTQTTAGNSYSFRYTYNLSGALESQQYPSGRIVNTCYDPAGRIQSVNGTATQNLAAQNYTGNSPVLYAPQGAIDTLTRGDGLTESWSYNNRLQPVSISVGLPGSPRSALGLDLFYCPNKAAVCSSNNGDLITTSSSLLAGDQSFSYDRLNRLTAAAEAAQSSPWSQGYGYDSYGNRWVNAGTVGSPFTPTAPSNFNTKNQLELQNSTYDAAGDLKTIGGYAYLWDPEARLVQSSISISGPSADTTYTYDGDGRRVMKQSPSTTTVFIYDASGHLAGEYSNSTASRSCGTCYLSVDHLGSTRMVTDQAGAVISRHDYFPFGEEIQPPQGGRNSSLLFAVADGISKKFTSKERDPESGLDYFVARYYGSALGRFTSPDPKGIPDEFDNPQAWNKYAYTGNNPLRYTDPDGKDWKDVVTGAFNAISSDNAFGAGRQSGNSDFRTGQAIGDGVAFVQGGLQVLAGAAGDVGGGLVSATGVGAPVGVPAIAASTAFAVDGAGVAATAAGNLITQASANKPGEVYVTGEQASGKKYVGRTTQGTEKRMKTRTDGRTGEASTVDTYQTTEEGQYKEQKAIHGNGGVQNLDNKRNEVSPERMKELEKKYGQQ